MNMYLVLYADDIVIISPPAGDLQKDFATLCEYSKH